MEENLNSMSESNLKKRSWPQAFGLAVLFSVWLVACSSGPEPMNILLGGTTEAGSTDNGSSDSGTTDNGSSDSGEPSEFAPIIRMPANTQAVRAKNISLAGSVSIPGMPIDIPVIFWEKLAGPGTVIFADVNKASTSASFDTVGEYELRLSAANGSYWSSDTMLVNVVAINANQAPVVDVGADETVDLSDVLNLSATVTDDGLPDTTLNGEWSKLSGPGSVTFGEISSANTIATFSSVGSYQIKYSVSDGDLQGSDKLAVQVQDSNGQTGNGNNVNGNNKWQEVITANGSSPQARHEAAAVAHQGKILLMGGRGQRQVNRYDPAANRWENLGTPALSMHHFQPVVYGGKIYVIGSLDCCFPSESVVGKIQIFDPNTKKWSEGASLPANRKRGSAGVVVRGGKIYMVGGSTNGHDGGMVNWFDEYNPANNQWKTLPDAPNARDHFSAAIVGNKLIAAGGRMTDHPNTFGNLVSPVDIYDFSTGKWSNGASIPTPRAGAMTVSYGSEVILIGGESLAGNQTLSRVEAYNVNTNSWRTLDSLNHGRHSGGAAIVDGAIHVISGNLKIGGGDETQKHEKLELN